MSFIHASHNYDLPIYFRNCLSNLSNAHLHLQRFWNQLTDAGRTCKCRQPQLISRIKIQTFLLWGHAGSLRTITPTPPCPLFGRLCDAVIGYIQTGERWILPKCPVTHTFTHTRTQVPLHQVWWGERVWTRCIWHSSVLSLHAAAVRVSLLIPAYLPVNLDLVSPLLPSPRFTTSYPSFLLIAIDQPVCSTK